MEGGTECFVNSLKCPAVKGWGRNLPFPLIISAKTTCTSVVYNVIQFELNDN